MDESRQTEYFILSFIVIHAMVEKTPRRRLFVLMLVRWMRFLTVVYCTFVVFVGFKFCAGSSLA
jgi:hypothetical protein